MIYNTGETDEQLKEKYNPEGSKLRKVQLRMLDMLDYIDSICKKEGILYRIEGGTCLGAIRHKGFIPWDDDLDVVLPRKEWKRLISYLKKNPHPQYKIQTHETDKGYMGAWAVFRDTKSEYIQSFIEHNIRKYRGMQIDLFPCDRGNLYFLRKLSFKLHLRFVTNNINRRRIKFATIWWIILYKFLFPFFRLFNVFGDKSRVSYSYGIGWIDFEKYYLKLVEVCPYKPIEFEGKFYPGPADPIAVVKRNYGNYMDLPPVDNRNQHQAEYKIWD